MDHWNQMLAPVLFARRLDSRVQSEVSVYSIRGLELFPDPTLDTVHDLAGNNTTNNLVRRFVRYGAHFHPRLKLLSALPPTRYPLNTKNTTTAECPIDVIK